MENTAINGRYRILRQIGVGGFGLTYLAEDLHLPTRPRCVVKLLKPQLNDAASLRLAGALFQQEAEILSRLASHPSIPNLLAHFEEKGEFYLVQEFIEGHTIAEEIFARRRYNQKEIIELLGQTLEILSFVHAQKVIHRDLKPANLIRREADGRIFLIDFGAVKLVNPVPRSENPNTFASVTVGSPGFMPIEQMAGNPNFSSDLYALGLIAIELLTGTKPLDLPKNANTNEFVWAHKAQLAAEVEQFIAKLVRYEFRQRFYTGKEALAALNAVAAAVGFFNQPPPRGHQTTIQPITSERPIPPHNFPAQMMPPVQIPPTIIVSPQDRPPVPSSSNQFKPVQHAPRQNFARGESSGDGASQYSKNYGRAVFWISGVLALLAVFFVVDSATRSTVQRAGLEENRKIEQEGARNLPAVNPNSVQETQLDVYREALKQADEAATKEKNATTKYEWQAIGNQYKRAYLLLGSVEQTHPNYAQAQATIDVFRQKSEAAYQKSLIARARP